MRLFHFSDDPTIASFEPRPAPSERPPGREWLNGPLVWAIDEAHQPLYLFPRQCPRVLLWPTPQTTAADRETWWGTHSYRMIAYIERAWLDRVTTACIYRYELPDDSFVSLDDAGMWVSHKPVAPLSVTMLDHLPDQLKAQSVDLRAIENLNALKDVWDTSLHASGIRLRNAKG
jgi:hypothetical protein